MLTETVFYLPNRFRQNILLNTHNVAFESSEVALLDLMALMFNLHGKTDLEFKIMNFVGSYRLFFCTTMLYESFFLASRIKLFDYLNKANTFYPNSVLNGFASGVVA